MVVDITVPRPPLLAICLLAALFLPVMVRAAEDEPNPLRFYQNADGSFLQASLGLDFAYFSQNHTLYGNDRGILGASVNSWGESLIRPGLEGRFMLPGGQSVYGKIDAVQANTFGGIDGGGTNIGLGDVRWLGIDKAYAGWRSGRLFGSLGDDFLDLSFGRQTYTTGTAFLFGCEGGAGFHRAAYYLGGRKSADWAAIARMKSGPWSGDLFYFEDDIPFPRNTTAGGGTLEYSFGSETSLGGSLAALESDRSSRDGMRVSNLRGSIKPFALTNGPEALRPLKIDGEFVHENRDEAMDSGFGWYLAASYRWSELPWKPELTYRYASFDENYDVLFYSALDWGSWFQGEITGECDLFNTNLDSHMVRLKVQPLEPLMLNLFYYRFTLHDPRFFGVESHDYVDEWNLIADWTVTRHLNLSLVGALAIPGDGATAYLGGDDHWTAGMVMVTVRY